MTKTEFQKLVDTIGERWPSAAEQFRFVGNVENWWKDLARVEFVDASAVLSGIYRGEIERPTNEGFLAKLRSESRLAAQRRMNPPPPPLPPARRPLEMLRDDELEAARTRAEFADLEAQYGADLDRMPVDRIAELAAELFGPYAARRVKLDPRTPLVRPLLLQEIAAGRIPAGTDFPMVQQHETAGGAR